jgi:YD repeat-containing protein
MNETDVTSPAGGTATSTFTNILGQTTQSWQYTATSSDSDGNVLAYAYDLLGRKTGVFLGSRSGTELDSWTYDQTPLNGGPAMAIGEQSSSTSDDTYGGASGGPYTEQVTGYDTAYRPTGTSTSIDLGDLRYAAMEETDAVYLADIGGGGDPDLSVKDPGAVCGGESFTAGTKVLLASGKTAPISKIVSGDMVKATDVQSGRTSAEVVTALLVHRDADRYDLLVRTASGTAVIQTTSSHLFWDPYLDQFIPADHLKKGERLKTPNGAIATADGGSVPADHDGWMWDLTVPGNNDHDFYVAVTATAVLVHNCTEGEEIANNIANHATERAQAGDGTHFVNGVSPQELPGYVHQVLDGEVPGVETRYLSSGRVGYWDPAKQAVIIEDGDGGTVLSPKEGYDYFEGLR